MAIANSLRAMHGAHKGEMTKTNLFMANLSLLHEEPGFNTREYDRPEVVDHIRNLADAYKAGDDLPPLRVQVVDGAMLIRDGHCRFRGALLAQSEGAEITRLAVLPANGDEIEQSLVILTSNEGLQLTSLERAKVYARLVGLNMSEAEVAKRVRKTVAHVQQYLTVHNMPIKLKGMIQRNEVSMSAALKLFNEVGTKAADQIEEQYEKALVKQQSKLPKMTNVVIPEIKDLIGGEAESERGNDEAVQSAFGGGVDTPQAHKIPEPPQKPVRVTQKDIDASRGYRSRLTGDAVRAVTTYLTRLVELVEQAEAGISPVNISLSTEDVNTLYQLQNAILPGSGKDEKC